MKIRNFDISSNFRSDKDIYLYDRIKDMNHKEYFENFSKAEIIKNNNFIDENYFTPTSVYYEEYWNKMENLSPKDNPVNHLELFFFVCFLDHAYNLNLDLDWLALDHQCGGYCLEHVRMIALEIKPKMEIYNHCLEIAKKFYFAQDGYFYEGNAEKDDLEYYNHALKEMGIISTKSHIHLRESFYPIDLTQENLDKISENKILIKDLFNKKYKKNFNPDNPIIVFLTANSD